jgi:PAS domain S-box-containing protein
MFSNPACGILAVDENGLILRANSTLGRYLGMQTEALASQPFNSILTPPARNLYQMQVLPQLKLGGILEECYLTLRRADGSDLPVLMNGAPLDAEAGGGIEWAVMPMRRHTLLEAELVAARRSAEEGLTAKNEAHRALAASEERTRRIIESAHEAFICTDTDGIITEWNQQAAIIFGWTAGEVKGRRVEDTIIPPSTREQYRAVLARHLETGRPALFDHLTELTVQRRNGENFIAEMTVSSVTTDRGTEFSCFLQDVTERKQAERQLLMRETLLRSLTDAIPGLVSFIDLHECHRYVNAAYSDTFGIDADDVIGKSLFDFFGEAQYKSLKLHIDLALHGEHARFEGPMTVRGEQHYMEGQFLPQLDAKGRVDGFYSLIWDITERRRKDLQLLTLAARDNLTGLLNRTSMMDAINATLAHCLQNGAAIAVLYFDVDRFKQINDRLGRAAGDQVLATFAQRALTA